MRVGAVSPQVGPGGEPASGKITGPASFSLNSPVNLVTYAYGSASYRKTAGARALGGHGTRFLRDGPTQVRRIPTVSQIAQSVEALLKQHDSVLGVRFDHPRNGVQHGGCCLRRHWTSLAQTPVTAIVITTFEPRRAVRCRNFAGSTGLVLRQPDGQGDCQQANHQHEAGADERGDPRHPRYAAPLLVTTAELDLVARVDGRPLRESVVVASFQSNLRGALHPMNETHDEGQREAQDDHCQKRTQPHAASVHPAEVRRITTRSRFGRGFEHPHE
jgi:hypothetical protein